MQPPAEERQRTVSAVGGQTTSSPHLPGVIIVCESELHTGIALIWLQVGTSGTDAPVQIARKAVLLHRWSWAKLKEPCNAKISHVHVFPGTIAPDPVSWCYHLWEAVGNSSRDGLALVKFGIWPDIEHFITTRLRPRGHNGSVKVHLQQFRGRAFLRILRLNNAAGCCPFLHNVLPMLDLSSAPQPWTRRSDAGPL